MKFDLTIVLICTLTIFSNSCYSLIAPFLPIELIKFEVDEQLTGYIFGIYSVSMIVVSPIIGYLLSHVGRRKSLSGGILLMAIAMVAFGLSTFIPSKLGFIIALFLIRLLQGFASAIIQTGSYSVVTVNYPTRQEEVIGYTEAS
jgi:MFS family permease